MNKQFVAIFFSVICPGLGQIINHQIIKGMCFIILGSTLLGISIHNFTLLSYVLIILWIWGIYDACKYAMTSNFLEVTTKWFSQKSIIQLGIGVVTALTISITSLIISGNILGYQWNPLGIRGPIDQEKIVQVTEKFFDEKFKIEFKVKKINFHRNENRSFYEITSNSLKVPSIEIKLYSYSSFIDTKGKLLVDELRIRGHDYANILWGKKLNDSIKLSFDNVLKNGFVFHTDISSRISYNSESFSIRKPYNLDDTYMEKGFKDFNFNTLVLQFYAENKFDMNKEVDKIYLLIKELSSKPWQQRHNIEIRYFNQRFDASLFNQINKENLNNYLLENKEKNFYVINLNSEDMRIIQSASDLNKYFKKMEE